MKDLTLVIPAKNEPESLPSVLLEVEKLNEFKDGLLILLHMIKLFFKK